MGTGRGQVQDDQGELSSEETKQCSVQTCILKELISRKFLVWKWKQEQEVWVPLQSDSTATNVLWLLKSELKQFWVQYFRAALVMVCYLVSVLN